MLRDTWTVMRKESKEILFPEGRFQGGARNVIALVGVAGLMFPLQSGTAWFTSWLTVYSACFPAIMLLNYTADAFAGERERHTLETLLASRLPDRAILVGKVLAIAAYGWGIVLICQPVAVMAINLVYRRDHLLFYHLPILVAIVGISLAIALLISTAGVLVSMTAPTARAAAQRMLVPFLIVFALPGAVPLIVRRLPGPMPTLDIGPGTVVFAIGVACLMLAAVLLGIAVARFRRERLVLA